jgi:hypothetical protein
MRNSRLLFGVTLMLSLASASCMRQKALARVFIPPQPRPKPTISDTPATLSDPPELSAEIRMTPPGLPEMVPETLEVPEAPKRLPRRTVPTAIPPAKPPATATPEAPAAPRLTQNFTAEEFRQHTRALDESLDRVNRALAVVEGKNLTAEQKDTVERIRTFVKQAEQARREEDLLTAVSLAKRADLFAKDLLERLP